jgi:hypothetical protein
MPIFWRRNSEITYSDTDISKKEESRYRIRGKPRNYGFARKKN